MSSSIVQHWRKLKGTVHPDDEAVFKTFTHNFNLDYHTISASLASMCDCTAKRKKAPSVVRMPF